MKIISWDVGIRNLAYCILEKTSDKSAPYVIHKWDLIDLLQDEQPTCSQCGASNVTYVCKHKDASVYFCTRDKGHFDKLQTELKNHDTFWTQG